MSEPAYLGHYRLERRLGEGTITITYLAYDPVRKRYVALKALRKEAPELQSIELVSFLERAQSASDLVHPHLAWIWESGELEGQPFLAERYVHGISLYEQLHRDGPLSWEKASTMLIQIAHGLEFAQQRGFLHGGVTPRNILLSEEHGAILTDTGLMHAIHSLPTRFQQTFFKKGYSSPEALFGRGLTPFSDQFSLACVLYETLTASSLPQDFQGLKPGEEVQDERLRVRIEGMPTPLKALFMRAWQFSPEQRFANMKELIESVHALNEVASDEIQPWLAQQREPVEREQTFAPEVEQARLQALEQARREVEEQLRQAMAIAPSLEQEAPPDMAEEEGPYLNKQIAPRRASTTKMPVGEKVQRPAWTIPLSLLFLVLLVLAGGLWLDRQLSGGGIFIHTATATTIVPTNTSTPPFTPSPSATNPSTASPTSSLTPTSSATATLTPSATPSPTTTPTSTRKPTHTPQPAQDIRRETFPPIPTLGGTP